MAHNTLMGLFLEGRTFPNIQKSFLMDIKNGSSEITTCSRLHRKKLLNFLAFKTSALTVFKIPIRPCT